MGCCASSIPTFPPADTARSAFPSSEPQEDVDFEKVAFIPEQNMMRGAIGVFFMNKDFDRPSYFFKPSGSVTKLMKLSGIDSDVIEVAQIVEGSEISDGYEDTDAYVGGGADYTENVTTYVSKDMHVKTSINGLESEVKVTKVYRKDQGGIECSLSEGFTKDTNVEDKCEDFFLNGDIVSKVYDEAMDSIKEKTKNGTESMNPREYLTLAKKPCAVYLKSHMSEEQKLQILTIIATTNERLIRMAQVDGSSSYNDQSDVGYGYNNDPYRHNNDHYGGNDEFHDDYDGGDDFGGGDDGGGGD